MPRRMKASRRWKTRSYLDQSDVTGLSCYTLFNLISVVCLSEDLVERGRLVQDDVLGDRYCYY